MFRSANGNPMKTPMGEGKGIQLTRRQLLKLGVFGAGVMVTGGAIAELAAAEDLLDGGKSVSRTTARVRHAVPSNCANCLSRCSILGFVEDAKLVKIEGNPADPNSRGRLCARGQAGVNRLYDPDRLPFPLERAGRRGEGKWVRLSWEQAYDVLEEKLRAVQNREQGTAVLHTGLEGPGLMARRFAAALGSAVLLDETQRQYASRQAANRLTMGTDSEVVDVAHARYLLNFGSNPYESHRTFVPFIQRLVDARVRGAKLVTFDPRMSLTAGRSDEWFPVLPGSDAPVILAMANVIVEQRLFDQTFFSQSTDLSPEQLAELLAPFTPEKAEAASGMPSGEVKRIALEFAKSRPAVAFSGGGVETSERSMETLRAMLLLNALVGSVGVQGGYNPAPTLAFPEPDPVPPQLPAGLEASQVVEEMLLGKRSVGVYMTALANPAYSWPDSARFAKALQDEDRVSYFVAIDTHLTETSMLADLVLPAATYLESWGLEAPVPMELSPFVSLRQPIVKPIGEALSIDDMLLTMGTRLEQSGARYFPFPTIERYLDAVIAKLPEFAAAGGLGLLREKGLWYDAGAGPRYRPKADGFETASGRLEFADMRFRQDVGSQNANVGVSGGNVAGDETLALVIYHTNVHFGDYSANSWWLAEIAHDNPLLIHPTAAHRRGITQGQLVRMTSPAGSIEVRARITEGINPQVVALASSFGHTALGRVARAERFESSDPMTAHIWWKERGNGVNTGVLMVPPITSGSTGTHARARVQVEAVG